MRAATEDEVNGRLKEYLAELDGEPLVITREGEPAAVLVPLPRDQDLEASVLAANPRFRAILERSRAQFEAGLALSEDEFWEQVGAAAASAPTAPSHR